MRSLWPHRHLDGVAEIKESAKLQAQQYESGADDPRRRHESNKELQVEDEENDPDKAAEEAVLAIVRVPLTAAVVPDAEFVKLNEADPEPPATSLSSASVSSIRISILPLL
jgi:hypothetical protein